MITLSRAPKFPFPAPSDDCISATEYIINNAEDLNVDREKIVLAGDSAGGELAIVTAIEIKYKMEDFNFAGLVPVYPCTQFLTHRMQSFEENESTGTGSELMRTRKLKIQVRVKAI